MVEEKSFREKQLQTIKEAGNIRQQIELLKKFLSLYKNSRLTEVAKKLFLLPAERKKEIERIREEQIPSDIGKGRKEYQVIRKRQIESAFAFQEAQLVEEFFDLAEQLTQDIKETNDKKLTLYLCRICYNTPYESDDEEKWDPITPAQAQEITPSMEEQQKELLTSTLFKLMIKKHASQEFAKKIELLIGDIREYNDDLRDKLLELTRNIAENNFEEQEETNKKIKSEINQNTKNIGIIWKKVFPTKKPPETIYDFDSWKHYVGWPLFLILVGYVFKKVRRIRKRKVKITQNYLVEIRQIFQEWQLNMYASTGAYVVGFYLIKQAIDKWVNPHISGLIAKYELITVTLVCLFIGGGFYLDGLITSSLKTPLQRLSIKIENAPIDEKVKKALLSKTQKVNELFKETLKRFGLLAVVGILIKLIETYWNERLITLLSYAVPLVGALKIIWEVDKTLKKLKVGGKKKN